MHCFTKNLPWRFVQLAIKNSCLPSLLARREWAMGHGSLHLATDPQTFPAGEFGSSACRAVRCGFAAVDSVLGSGVATPGRCRHCSVQDWQPTRTGSAPTLPRRDLCGSAASRARVFSSPALGRECGALLSDRGRSSWQERLLVLAT